MTLACMNMSLDSRIVILSSNCRRSTILTNFFVIPVLGCHQSRGSNQRKWPESGIAITSAVTYSEKLPLPYQQMKAKQSPAKTYEHILMTFYSHLWPER